MNDLKDIDNNNSTRVLVVPEVKILEIKEVPLTQVMDDEDEKKIVENKSNEGKLNSRKKTKAKEICKICAAVTVGSSVIGGILTGLIFCCISCSKPENKLSCMN